MSNANTFDISKKHRIDYEQIDLNEQETNLRRINKQRYELNKNMIQIASIDPESKFFIAFISSRNPAKTYWKIPCIAKVFWTTLVGLTSGFSKCAFLLPYAYRNTRTRNKNTFREFPKLNRGDLKILFIKWPRRSQ